MARPISLRLPGDRGYATTLVDTPTLLRIMQEHGADIDEFLADRTKDWRKPYTLEEIRDWLGY